MNSTRLKYLNVGCGKRFHPSWINIDILPTDPEVLVYDVRRGFPFDDNCMEVVYHAHVLEHIPKAEVQEFLLDCFRVLRPGGVMRVVVPDLEQIARHYIRLLEQNTTNTTSKSGLDYDWIMLELLDQTARDKKGGEMLHYLSSDPDNRDFVLSRIGEEARPLLSGVRHRLSLREKMKKFTAMRLRVQISLMASFAEDLLHSLLPGGKYYKVGKFRMSGETHQWMYDRYSLDRLLRSVGFVDYKIQSAFTSSISEWESFELDGKDGVVFKPDSIFVEVGKPH